MITVLAMVNVLAAIVVAQSADKPNILFLFADDQRADTIGALGNPHIKTPNIDKLVKSGVSFDRAYMQGGLQGATCVPSRAMLLSGVPLFRVDEKLLRDPTWPAAFGKAGYNTFVSGKWHNGPASLPLAFQQARSMLLAGMTDPMKARLSDLDNGKVGPAKLAPKHACAMFADQAIDFISGHGKGPFFCYVPFDAPHDPHIVPDDFPVKYDPATMPAMANFMPVHPFNNGEMTVRDELLLPWPRKREAVSRMNADYYRYVSYLDFQVGRILDALNKSPYASNTIVVYAADSGVARGAHGLIGKQNLYEDSLRVPLVISGPGIAKGERTQAMCYLFDVLPTLGSLCCVPKTSTSEGIDLTGVLKNPKTPGRPRLSFGYRTVQRAVRDGRWKLIVYPDVNVKQLFDLETDPNEITNLADKAEHANRVKELMVTMATDLRSHGDRLPLEVANPIPATWSPPQPKRPVSGAKQ